MERSRGFVHGLLSVCWLLYRSSVVDEKTGRTAFRDFRRDKATMWRLFEDFVTDSTSASSKSTG